MKLQGIPGNMFWTITIPGAYTNLYAYKQPVNTMRKHTYCSKCTLKKVQISQMSERTEHTNTHNMTLIKRDRQKDRETNRKTETPCYTL